MLLKCEVKEELVLEGDHVSLKTDGEIQKNDQIRWLFGDENYLITEVKEGTKEMTTYDDGRFRDRLELNKKTGSLTIKNTRTEHTGLYKLKISSDKGATNKIFNVTVRGE